MSTASSRIRPWGARSSCSRSSQQNLIWEKVAVPVTWVDGHDAYDDITNPVVRLRFDERTVPGPPIERPRIIYAVSADLADRALGLESNDRATAMQAKEPVTRGQSV